jgi:hypothetical protein
VGLRVRISLPPAASRQRTGTPTRAARKQRGLLKSDGNSGLGRARQGKRAQRRLPRPRPTPASLRRAELSHGRSYRADLPRLRIEPPARCSGSCRQDAKTSAGLMALAVLSSERQYFSGVNHLTFLDGFFCDAARAWADGLSMSKSNFYTLLGIKMCSRLLLIVAVLVTLLGTVGGATACCPGYHHCGNYCCGD